MAKRKKSEIPLPQRTPEIKPPRDPEVPSAPEEDPAKIPVENPDKKPPVEIPPDTEGVQILRTS